MKKISASGIVLGGLLAGVVLLCGEYILNILLLGKDVEEATRVFRNWLGGWAVAFLTINTIALGVIVVWLYAIMQARFGSGLKTKLLAALTVWFLAWFHCAIVASSLGVSAPGFFWLTAAWGLLEVPAAGLIGTWLYQRMQR